MVTLFLVIGLVTTNCSDTNLSPEGNTVTETVVSDFKTKKGGVPAGLISNSQKYNDSSMPSASGSDGEATVTSRALIDNNGNVDLEVTTGELDSGETAPGTITKIQVKALDTDNPDKDNPDWTKNYNKLRDGGYFSTSYTGLERGQEVFVHANVKGIKKKGTAVVFMTETIKARPDIKLIGVAPSAEEVLVDDDVIITANIAEGNADLGATTSCVLYIDGNEIDRASNVWVDAGDVVSCQFTTSFDATGEKNIVVSAEDVTPGDYDSSNNSAYTTVTVIEPETAGPNGFYWSGGTFMSGEYYYERYYANGNYEVRENKNYLVYFYGNKSGVSNFSMPSKMGIKITSSDQIVIDQEFPLEPDWGTSYRIPWDSELRLYGNINYSSNTIYFNVNFNTSSQVYYGFNEYQGDFYNSYSSGIDFDMGDDLTFEFQIGDQTASGSVIVNSNTYEYRQDYGPNDYYLNRSTNINGWGSGQPEVGAESEDEEGENDEEEEY
ncbi:MAG: hypothetical protein JJ895_11855 [Balneolaceae bacterium]|nr:hypothetical protein [Balneolaceae bacterium]